MKIKEKINLDYNGLIEHGPINIVAFGDSVTHGALLNSNNYETVYLKRVKYFFTDFYFLADQVRYIQHRLL